MKVLISSLIFFASASAFAQVNLDQRINVSHADQVYSSMNEPNIAYMMPLGLARVSDVKVLLVGKRINVQFDVGVPESEFARIDSLLVAAGKTGVKAAVVRALDATVVPRSGTNIDNSFDPKIMVAGDPRNLSGPVRYMLSVRNIISHGHSETAKMLATLFGGQGIDNVANIALTFDAVALGKPYLAQTAIGLFAGKRDGAPALVVPKKGISSLVLASMLTSAVEIVPTVGAPASVQFVEDKIAGCWGNPKPGVICLK